jgi:hypothetical protein
VKPFLWFPDNPRKADIRHVIENLRKVSRNLDQGAVWACAEAPTKNAHDNALGNLPKEAAEYLTNNVKVEHYALYTFLEGCTVNLVGRKTWRVSTTCKRKNNISSSFVFGCSNCSLAPAS